MTEKIAALLPMKGHSERVPGKNLRLFAGKPLCFHILETLSKARSIGMIAIDTDSEEIAKEAAAHFQVRIIERPQALRGDLVPMTDILRHDISLLVGDVFLQTHATNPLLRASTIDEAVDRFFADRSYDSLCSITPLQTRLYWPDGRAINHDPNRLMRTQDLEPVYEENSNVYVFTRECLLSTGRRVGRRPRFFVMEKEEAVDIDTEFDFKFAEALMQGRVRP